MLISVERISLLNSSFFYINPFRYLLVFLCFRGLFLWIFSCFHPPYFSVITSFEQYILEIAIETLHELIYGPEASSSMHKSRNQDCKWIFPHKPEINLLDALENIMHGCVNPQDFEAFGRHYDVFVSRELSLYFTYIHFRLYFRKGFTLIYWFCINYLELLSLSVSVQ